MILTLYVNLVNEVFNIVVKFVYKKIKRRWKDDRYC
uniref:Uncharacterized protein n=1 Tax=Siphoviridae sp. ctPZa1 TaxID=2826323 RepID=A0A8S5ND97_9CAUD|nr:MAG TPA: hypothetical protein [Siphoviridae sp. ctPZa1]